MANRLMIHNGKSKVTEPAQTSRYFDPDLNEYVEEILSPAREVEITLQDGAKFGGYVVRKPVPVPSHMQATLLKKGFRFVNEEDHSAFLKEHGAKIEAAKKRAEAQQKAEEAKAEKKAAKDAAKAKTVADNSIEGGAK